MPINMTVETRGFKEVQRFLRGKHAEAFYAEEYRDVIDALAKKGEHIAAQSAPSGRTGQLELRIGHRVQKRALPTWFVVRSFASRRSAAYPRGFFYGRILNFAAKYGHLGWFTGPLKRLGAVAGPILSSAARSIEHKWGRLR